MKNITLSVLIALSGACVVPAMAQSSNAQPSSELAVAVSEQQYSDADIDSILAPIALYPDTLLTHILIAATYPLDVVAADRWRQSNQHLTPEQVEDVLEDVTWDPSVKALAPFTDLLNTMAKDLEWLQQLGDNVLISQERVLDRVQVLRQHAHNTGNLVTNDYIEVETERERDREIIYIEPRQREVVYVPYYNPHVVYGHWWHARAPIFWNHRISYHHHHNVFWAPRVRLSTFFYFGGVHWHNRHVVIHRTPVRRYFHGSPRKRVISHGYQRWEHRIDHRRARYSSRVVRSAPARFERQTVVRTQKQVRNVIPPKAVTPLRQRDIRVDKARTSVPINRKQTVEHALKRNQAIVAKQRPSRDVAMAQLKRDKPVRTAPQRKQSQRIERAYSQPKSLNPQKPQRIAQQKVDRARTTAPSRSVKETTKRTTVKRTVRSTVNSTKQSRSVRQSYSAKPQRSVTRIDKSSSQRKFAKN
ncbi:DUF3300 domain-containing protein [Alteromonas gracilis]|uniref:DUF3300 domain-containing protein n=1 Tax=Alteromonas gracilis TaxID=1479524 RepID=UPI00321B06AA